MPVTTLVLIVVFAIVAIVTARNGRRRRTGWRWFSLWMVPGFLSAFATLSFAIGLLVLPFAVAALVLAARLSAGAEMLGLLPGVGAMCFLIAALNVGESMAIAGWIAAAVAFVAFGVGAYTTAR